MRITQGTFSFLPEFTDEPVAAQIRYSLHHGWAMSVEYTDDPASPQLLLGDVGAAPLRPRRRPGRHCPARGAGLP